MEMESSLRGVIVGSDVDVDAGPDAEKNRVRIVRYRIERDKAKFIPD